MASFRGRFEGVQVADVARTALIEDLIRKVDDLEKTMDRNAFVLVLIDGDGMNFLDDLVNKGIAGGDEASSRLRREVFNAMKPVEDFRHDTRIVIKVYANIRGLSKLYTQYGLLSKPEDFGEFVLGFNKAHPLCDFIDGGNQKEAADKKIQETLNLYAYNVHCKHIIFGASADNSYASFLGSFHDIDIANRIRLLEGPPFALEFKTILPRFKQLKFPEIFRSTKIDITQRHFSPLKKSAVDTPKRRIEAPADELRQESVFSSFFQPTTAKKTIDHKLPPSFVDKAISQSLPDRTSQASPAKASFSPFARPVSPTKTPQEPTSGGVSLRPRQQSNENTALFRLAAAQLAGTPPPTERIEKALIRATLEALQENPRSCDFANVRRRAESKLGVDANIWGASEADLWFNRSKRTIKWTVEQWLALTNSALPGNATWLFKHFPAGKSVSSVLGKPAAQEWRTPGEPEWQKIFDRAVVKLGIS